MSSDCFQTAAEGWRIITRYTEPRQSARYLLRWLVETLNLSMMEISYRNDTDDYQWQERVIRVVPGTPPGVEKARAFPGKPSEWRFKGNMQKFESWEILLDLLAEQWLRVSDFGTGRTERNPKWTSEPRYPGWTAVSRSARIIRSGIPSLSQSISPLLLIGENGCGRRHLAEIVHINGMYPDSPFGSPDDGNSSGTLYVPEWNHLTPEEKIRACEDSRRLIAAVPPAGRNEDYRRDWLKLHRGDGCTMAVPPLRERREDIPALTGDFLKQALASSDSRIPEITPGALDILREYPWPGNVVELREVLFRTLENMDRDTPGISAGMLPPEIRGSGASTGESSFPEKLVALEYEALRKELSRQHGNMTRTARALGLTPRQVSWRVRKYGINPREFKPHLQTDQL